jgi:hypothetical protein
MGFTGVSQNRVEEEASDLFFWIQCFDTWEQQQENNDLSWTADTKHDLDLRGLSREALKFFLKLVLWNLRAARKRIMIYHGGLCGICKSWKLMARSGMIKGECSSWYCPLIEKLQIVNYTVLLNLHSKPQHWSRMTVNQQFDVWLQNI